MILKINGIVVEEPKVDIAPILEYEKTISKLEEIGKRIMKASPFIGMVSAGKIAFAASAAAGLADKLMPLIHLLQDFALPVGIGMATWGLIEVMIGNPGGKQKIKSAVIGFIGIFLIPTIFYAIRDAFGGQ